MDVEDQTQKHPAMKEGIEELKRMKDIAFPIATMGLVNYLKSMISVVCMGRLGPLELAGGSLAIGFTNITGYSVISGLAMGMDPLCSQAFGSGNLPLVALTVQRTILMLLSASIPIGLLWASLEPIMLSLHQKPDITRIASLYCQFALPDLIANSLLQPLRIYLRNRGTPWPLMWCSLFGVVLHLPITFFLTFTLRLGVPGIAIATYITNFNILIFLLCYMFYTSSLKDLLSTPFLPMSSLTLSSTISFGKEWAVLLRLALPSCLAVCLEWWWYEFMTLLSGYLPKPHVTLATSAIVIQTTSLMYTLPNALSSSVSTRVGNALGSGHPSKAHLATIVSMLFSILVSVSGLLWTTIGRGAWGRIFTQDKDILKLTMAVLPIIGLCELANCPQTTGCGVLRGSARPAVCATINLYSFYIVGAPVALVMAFSLKQGFLGLCYGLLAAQVVCAISIVTMVSKTDWYKESLKAKDLVGRDASLGEEQTTVPQRGQELLG